MNIFYWFVITLCRMFFPLFFRIKIEGKENVPKDGAFIICGNHIAVMDLFLIAYKLRCVIHYMAKSELFKKSFSRMIMNLGKAFPVTRDGSDIQGIRKALRLLKDGKVIGIFPEGTRIKDIKNMDPKIGIAMLAARSGVPVIPVGLSGDYKLFGRINVKYGKPYVIDKSKKYTHDELQVFANEIMDEVYKF